MEIVRGPQTTRSRMWTVITAGNTYRVTWYWSIGSLRMEWRVEASAKLRNGSKGWRQIKGLWLIDAVREHEASTSASQ